MKQSISGHSFRHCDGRTPVGSRPLKQKTIDGQKGKAGKFLSPSGQRGYEVVQKGAKSDSSTSKLASGGEQTRDDMERWAKQKAHIHSGACTKHGNDAKLTERLPPRSILYSHTEEMPNSLQTSSLQPTLSTLQSEITLQSARSTTQPPDPPCQKCESHYTAPQSCVVLGEENNQRSTHPSIQREGRIAFPIFPLI